MSERLSPCPCLVTLLKDDHAGARVLQPAHDVRPAMQRRVRGEASTGQIIAPFLDDDDDNDGGDRFEPSALPFAET